MENFIFHNPTRIVFGEGVIDQVGEQTRPHGGKVLLVYGRNSIKANGIYDRITTSLVGAGLEIVEFSGVKPNPVLSHLRQGIELAKKERPDCLVAVGGGSVLDEAKAIAAGAVTDIDVWDFFTGKATIEKALPLVTVLTVAATGSEMNPTGVVTNEETLQKFEISAPPLYPRTSLLDPTVLYTLSSDYTAYSCVDVISHVIEAYFTAETRHTPIQDRLVENIIVSVMESCETCLEDPHSYQGRATFMWAATLALNGLPVAGVGSFSFPNHMIEHSLSAIYDIAHGAGLAIVIPGWMSYTAEKSPEKFARFGREIFGIQGNSETQLAHEAIQRLKSWFAKIGAPVSLEEAGIPASDIPAIAENASMLARKWGLDAYTVDEIATVLNHCK